jgi:hypothetical protein
VRTCVSQSAMFNTAVWLCALTLYMHNTPFESKLIACTLLLCCCCALCVGEHCALVNTALQEIGYTCCIRSGEVLQPNGVYVNALGHRIVFVDLGAEGTYVLDVSAIQLFSVHMCVM